MTEPTFWHDTAELTVGVVSVLIMVLILIGQHIRRRWELEHGHYWHPRNRLLAWLLG